MKTARPLPSKEENCAEEIVVTEEDIEGAFKKFYTPIHILVSVQDSGYRSSEIEGAFKKFYTPIHILVSGAGRGYRIVGIGRQRYVLIYS